MKAWVGDGCTGALLGPDEARVSVMDHGFTVGDGVFETLKVTPRGAFAVTRHLRRLATSAAMLGLAAPDLDHVREAADRVIAACRDEVGELARLRITWTSGAAPLGSDRVDAPPTLVIAVMRQQPWPESTRVITIPGVRNPASLVAGAKSTSYAENVVALVRAHEAGASEAIFGTIDGRLCEGTGSNVLVAIDGRMITPTLASGCLAGITRELALEWLGIVEQDVPLEVMDGAVDALVSSSTRDLHPITSIDGREFSAGPMSRELARAFAARTESDLDP